eukprot:CAMPEP_0181318018 /NCGR_PEP_ID=MMETSP1101-20121128/16781_1 /TAXON_ID=46948 /ORGANISM="Rhodomonas abbreviata, Strain Caron Lab Isolate" /LENGTH=976 /DNA_ID=CAMNT_0023425457 /DNA_START=323 /DNA_END=3254 /DNA_ORIENTATION=-
MKHFPPAKMCLPGSRCSVLLPLRTIKQQSATVRFFSGTTEEQDKDAPGTGQGQKTPNGTKPPSSEEDVCMQRLDQARNQLRDAMVALRLVDPEDKRKQAEAEAGFAIAEIQVAEAKVELAKARKDPVAEARAEVELAKARKDPVAEAEAKVELAKERKDPVAEARAEVELAKARKDPVAEARAEVELAKARKDPVAEAEAKVQLDKAQKDALAGATRPANAPASPGKQGVTTAPESGLRQVLRGSCPLEAECECAQLRNTHRTPKLTWQNQKIIGAILENSTGPVFLEREAQMEQVVSRMLERQRDWRGDKQRNPLLCVPNSPGTGKSLFAAMLGQALEAGCLEGRSVAQVIPTLTAENDTGDGNFTTVVSAFTYNSGMSARLNLGNQCAALFCRALYGSLGAKCSQLSAVSFEDFASAARAQEMWGESDVIRREYKALTGGAENNNTNFVLVVDELAKISSSEDPSESARQTLTELGAWLDASPNHHAVVTALHEQFVRTGVTGSNRNVEIATIVTDLSCVNGNAEALMPVFRGALDIEEKDLTQGVRLQLQRTIALTGGHPRSLEQLYKALGPSGSSPRLRQEILKDRRADWKAIVNFGLDVVTPLVTSSIRHRLAEKSRRAELWSALSEVLLCREVETDKFKELVEDGSLHLAGRVTEQERLKARVDTKPLTLMLLLHAARTPGCRNIDPSVLQLARLLFEGCDKDAGCLGIGLDSDGLPAMINREKCIAAFSKGRLSASAERVVCWGVGRMLVAEEPHLRSRLLGALVNPPGAAPVCVVPPLETGQSQASAFEEFERRLSVLNASEMQIYMAPANYPAADFYVVNQTKVEVAVQVKLFWNASAIAAIRKSAQKVKTGSGVLEAPRFVLLICSDAMPPADIASLTAPGSKDDTEAPVDDVLVAEDLGKVVPRSLMRLTWMDIPTDSEDHDAGTDDREDGFLLTGMRRQRLSVQSMRAHRLWSRFEQHMRGRKE